MPVNFRLKNLSKKSVHYTWIIITDKTIYIRFIEQQLEFLNSENSWSSSISENAVVMVTKCMPHAYNVQGLFFKGINLIKNVHFTQMGNILKLITFIIEFGIWCLSRLTMCLGAFCCYLCGLQKYSPTQSFPFSIIMACQRQDILSKMLPSSSNWAVKR